MSKVSTITLTAKEARKIIKYLKESKNKDLVLIQIPNPISYDLYVTTQENYNLQGSLGRISGRNITEYGE